MATQPSKTILQGCTVLKLMGAHPRELRTAARISELSEGALSVSQVEGALLAFAEAGFVQVRPVDGGPTFYLLGAAHLELATAELRGLLDDLSTVRHTLGGAGALSELAGLLNPQR